MKQSLNSLLISLKQSKTAIKCLLSINPKKITLLLTPFLAMSLLSGCFLPFFIGRDLTSQETSKNLIKKRKVQNRQIILGEASIVSYSEKQNWKKHTDNQWALKDILALDAWELTRGDSSVVVAVIDTGIHTNHPCLKSNLWINKKEIPNNNKDDDGNGFIDDIHGWNFVDNNNKIQDHHGHGTHIAGIIAATGKTKANPDCKLSGVSPNIRLMILKYYDKNNNHNNIQNTIKSIQYAVKNKASIINYSGGGPGPNEEERFAIAKANDRQILFISAAGNESAEIQNESYYPASYGLPNIFTVQSTNQDGEILESSNWMKVDWRKKDRIYVQTAPGEDVISTLPPRKYIRGSLVSNLWRTLAIAKVNHNNYGYMTGTSQATAVSTGVAALIKSIHPSWTPQQVIKQMNNTGFSGNTNLIKKKTKQGKKLNAYEALTMRDQTIDFDDRISQPGISMPATDKAYALKNLNQRKGSVDVYDPQNTEKEEGNNPLSILQKINRSLSSKKKK